MSDITFGEVADATPQPALRPDRNAQWATVAYGEPGENDLPVFIDLDVLCELEEHAQSNTSVELGGVLLGGQWLDDDGRPFVTITEAIRAEHYEATRGSFKFTHDTWSSISRRRDEFAPELAMVGWYHTHPDWGVFLSHMDQFICENFFPRPHDVALVIDPCRGDRGIFQWTGRAGDELRRVRGFQVFASRFREAELTNFVTQLEGRNMPVHSGSGAANGSPAPVIHIVEPRGSGQQLAVLGMLTIQFCFLALLAWRMLALPAAAPEVAATAGHERREAEIAAERAALNRVLDRVSAGTGGLASELQKSNNENEKLRAAVAGYGALEREKTALEKSLTESRRSRDDMNKEIDELKDTQAQANLLAKEQTAQIADLKKRLGDGGEERVAEARTGIQGWNAPLLIGAIAVVVLLAGGMALVVARRRGQLDDAAEPGDDSLPRTVPVRPTVTAHNGG